MNINYAAYSPLRFLEIRVRVSLYYFRRHFAFLDGFYVRLASVKYNVMEKKS